MRNYLGLVLVLLATPALAQRYEGGAHGGGSYYFSKSVTAGGASADAGFKFGYAAGASIGHNMYERIGGELRYTYLRNALRVASDGTEVTFGAESHAIHYDLLFHTAPRASRVRPYVAAGAGVKYYRGTGAEVVYRPLQQFAIPTRTHQAEPMV